MNYSIDYCYSFETRTCDDFLISFYSKRDVENNIIKMDDVVVWWQPTFIIESKFLIPLCIRQTASSLLVFVLTSVVDHSSRARVREEREAARNEGGSASEGKKVLFPHYNEKVPKGQGQQCELWLKKPVVKIATT